MSNISFGRILFGLLLATVSSEGSFRWTQVEGRIEIEYDCPPNANCLAGPHLIARVTGFRLAATLGAQMLGRAPLYYAEAASPQ